MLDIIDKVEQECEISLDWFYHSPSYYDRDIGKSILTEGIKCNELLKNGKKGRHNGLYYISLSKITIPDNACFYVYNNVPPSFIINGIEPIKCENNDEYLKYIDTKAPRRIGSYEDEYQYYYFIKNTYINGILFDLLNTCKMKREEVQLKKILDLISLLEELDMDLPIYDYSRREKTLAHTIDKERLKYYSKDIL